MNLDSKTGDGGAEAVCGSRATDRASAAAAGRRDPHACSAAGGRGGQRDEGQGAVVAQAGSPGTEQGYHQAASGGIGRICHGGESG